MTAVVLGQEAKANRPPFPFLPAIDLTAHACPPGIDEPILLLESGRGREGLGAKELVKAKLQAEQVDRAAFLGVGQVVYCNVLLPLRRRGDR